ncbi:hypothetical protein Moror_3242 [Moniliophthora roreri MCA 2997]|uniref:Uncharacterized protein n=1 Tax=Moniliophthora roreri (strain MCA 2997) TaxID=1381753 RepID=V2WMA4_MONRO|nr:hypothetical protein Moror_3242 [Moniliophthora roreri MCA 2997]
MTVKKKKSIHYEASSAFALFWNLVYTILPLDVKVDLQEFVTSLKLPHMDPGLIYTGKAGFQYVITLNGNKIPFCFAEIAPPCSVFAQNHAR